MHTRLRALAFCAIESSVGSAPQIIEILASEERLARRQRFGRKVLALVLVELGVNGLRELAHGQSMNNLPRLINSYPATFGAPSGEAAPDQVTGCKV